MQGPAATLRQHCPQMTRRRCKGIQNEMVPTTIHSKILNLCKYKMYQDVLIRTEVHQRVLSSTKVESPAYFIQTLLCVSLSTSNLFGQLLFKIGTWFVFSSGYSEKVVLNLAYCTFRERYTRFAVIGQSNNGIKS